MNSQKTTISRSTELPTKNNVKALKLAEAGEEKNPSYKLFRNNDLSIYRLFKDDPYII
jgi:hypothetical protein